MRVNIYIDGFNLYYGLYTYNPKGPDWVKKEVSNNRKCKWLDFLALFTEILPDDNKIQVIKYFTAFVNGQRDPSKPIRQQAYIHALQQYRDIEVILGQFKSGAVNMPYETPIGGDRYAKVIKTEEKGSDVNLAVNMVNDGWQDKYDIAVVCSNDTDLIEAIKIVRTDICKKICWVTPSTVYPSKELAPHVDFHRKIQYKHLKKNQLPETIPGTKIVKPVVW